MARENQILKLETRLRVDGVFKLASRRIGKSALIVWLFAVWSGQSEVAIVEAGRDNLFSHLAQRSLPLLASLSLIGDEILKEHASMGSDVMKGDLFFVEQAHEELA